MNQVAFPIIAVICVAAMVIAFSILNGRNKLEVQRTLRIALERGTPLTADLVAQMNTNSASPRGTDLRRGVIIMAIGLAALAAGLITNSLTQFATVGVFPLFMGMGFLVVWKLDKGQRTA
jgi:hypothetical protein